MRITSEMMVANSVKRLSARLEQYERSQSALASGKRLRAPSDDPAGANRALGLRAQQRAREQESRNATDAKAWLDSADSQLQGALERLHRVRELALRASSTVSVEERSAIAAEMVQVRDELVGLANARVGNRPLFAGNAAGEAVRLDDGAWTFAGDDGAVTRRVGERDVVRVNVSASAVFGFSDRSSGSPDVFTMVDRLTDRVLAGDTGAVSSGLADLDVARTRLNRGLAEVGAAANRVESALRRSAEDLLSVRSQLAEVEDVDVPAAIMELQTQETAYQATLQALSKALPPSLVSFLR